jgi:hypothetical protein
MTKRVTPLSNGKKRSLSEATRMLQTCAEAKNNKRTPNPEEWRLAKS